MEPQKPEPGNVPNGTPVGADEPMLASPAPGKDPQWLHWVVENSSENVTIVDPDGTLRYASPAFGRMLGYDPKEAVGTMNVLDHVHPDDLPHVLEETENALSEGGITSNRAEYRFRHADGSWRWVESVGIYLLGDPHVGGVVVHTRDVTDRKKAEGALKESEERHRSQSRELALLHQVRSALAQELDEPSVFYKAVEAVAEAYGYTQVSAYLLEDEELVLQHQVGYERVIERIPLTECVSGRAVRSGHPVFMEDVSADPDFLGAVEGVTSELCVPLLDEDRAVGVLNVESTGGAKLTRDDLRLMVAVGEHVSVAMSRAKLYTRVWNSEEHFRALTQNSSDIVTLLRAVGTIRYQSPAIERILGYRPEETIGDNAFDYVHPDDRKRVEMAFAEGLKNPRRRPSAEYRFRHKDGSWVWLESVGTNLLNDPGVGEFVVNSREVTGRKEAEEALRESEQRFRRSFDDAPIGMALVAPDGHFLRTNRYLCEMLGYPEKELLGKTFQDITHPDDLDADLDHLHRMRAGEIRTYQTEKRYFHKEGHAVWALLSVSVVHHEEEGEPLHFVSHIQDVTERKEAERKLREAEWRYRSLVERMPAVVYIQEIESPDSAMYMSPQIETLTGYAPEECKNTDFRWGMVHPDDRERMQLEAERTGEPGEVFNTDYRVIHRDGHTKWVRYESVIIEEEVSGSRYWQGFMLDITERKKAEEEVKEANRRLEELAVLKADFTAMVAHELETPLAVIRGYAEILATGALEPAEQSRALDKIREETEVLNTLVGDVRAVATVEQEDFTVQLQPVPVRALLYTAVQCSAPLLGNHPLVTENGADDVQVWADSKRIRQVLYNLMANAAKYSPDSTPIELRAKPGKTPGRVQIEVADRGTGVHPDDVSRIFEKFGRGRDRSGQKVAGVGLGLYLSRRIMRAHGSDLTLSLTSDSGSVFSFELVAAR